MGPPAQRCPSRRYVRQCKSRSASFPNFGTNKLGSYLWELTPALLSTSTKPTSEPLIATTRPKVSALRIRLPKPGSELGGRTTRKPTASPAHTEARIGLSRPLEADGKGRHGEASARRSANHVPARRSSLLHGCDTRASARSARHPRSLAGSPWPGCTLRNMRSRIRRGRPTDQPDRLSAELTGKIQRMEKPSMAIKDPNRVTDDRRKAAAMAASQAISAGKGINTVAADHVGSETCAQAIARATK